MRARDYSPGRTFHADRRILDGLSAIRKLNRCPPGLRVMLIASERRHIAIYMSAAKRSLLRWFHVILL
jgi:hypothetical protein